MYVDGLIDHSNSYDIVVDKSVNLDQENCLEDYFIKNSFGLNKDEDVSPYKIDDGEFSLEEDVIFYTCKE